MIEQIISEAASAIIGSELWGRVFFAAVAIFAATQAFKFIFNIHKRIPKLCVVTIRMFAGVVAYPLTFAIMIADGNILTHWAIPIPHAVVAWMLAHYLSDYFMPFLKEFFPRVHRVFGGKK